MTVDAKLAASLARAHEALGCAVAAAGRADSHLTSSRDRALLADAVASLSVVQMRVGDQLRDELEDSYTAHCGHRQRRGVGPTCGCGPAAF